MSFLKEKNLIYRRHKILTQKELEKIPFKKNSLLVSWMVESTKYEFVEVLDEATFETKFYWLIGKASNYLFPFNKVNLSLKEEVDIDIIEIFFDLTPYEALIADEFCPACNKTITQDDSQCPDCGLFFQ
jgi:UDP-N-acetylenolpyruvoylglucosamine reductase